MHKADKRGEGKNQSRAEIPPLKTCIKDNNTFQRISSSKKVLNGGQWSKIKEKTLRSYENVTENYEKVVALGPVGGGQPPSPKTGEHRPAPDKSPQGLTSRPQVSWSPGFLIFTSAF